VLAVRLTTGCKASFFAGGGRGAIWANQVLFRLTRWLFKLTRMTCMLVHTSRWLALYTDLISLCTCLLARSWGCVWSAERQSSSYSSIMFVVVFSVTTTFALAALALPENFEHYLNLIKALEIPAMIIFSGKTVLAWPLCYHAFNGIRHLVCICRFNYTFAVYFHAS